jgi:phosphoglycerate dehydrogenase-like enzyme
LIAFEPSMFTDSQIAEVQAAAPDKRVLVTDDREEIEAVLDDVEIAVGGFPHDLLVKAPNLRWFQMWSAGADWLMRTPQAVELDFVLTSASGLHAIPISEHIFGFMLAFARGLHGARGTQQRREWPPRDELDPISELAGKTMVLVGLGSIGQRTARLARAFDMRVLGVRRHPRIDAPNVEAVYGPDALLDLIPEADFVVLAIPHTHETHGMIGEPEFRAMKPTAYFVNIGRGGVVQERALIGALEEGWIAGAGLDVFETEPLPQDSPLWAMHNVLVTGHYSGATPHYTERALDTLIDNLQRYSAGEPMRNVVDKRLGY